MKSQRSRQDDNVSLSFLIVFIVIVVMSIVSVALSCSSNQKDGVAEEPKEQKVDELVINTKSDPEVVEIEIWEPTYVTDERGVMSRLDDDMIFTMTSYATVEKQGNKYIFRVIGE